MLKENKWLLIRGIESGLANKIEEAQERFKTASNDFYRVIALNDQLDYLGEELNKWELAIAMCSNSHVQEDVAFVNKRGEYMADLMDLSNSIILQVNSMLRSALTIQRAMINGGLLKAKLITNEIPYDAKF